MDYRKDSKPTKRTALKIVNAYMTGVACIDGVEYVAFGRDNEVRRFEQTMKVTKDSAGRMEAFVGPYGVGKSFILALFQNLATKKGFVVMSADIKYGIWFKGSKNERQGLNLYRELIKNTAIKGSSMNAFDNILEKWYNEMCDAVGSSKHALEEEFNRVTRDCRTLPLYSDIRAAILTRFDEFREDKPYSEAMDFFLANITRKSDAKQKVGASDYIREERWFEIMNTWAHIFVKAGYKGLIILIDQVDFLCNLQKSERQQNYEFLLSMWNDVNQGRTEYLSICLFGADKLIDDERRGVQMYPALYDRLASATRLDVLESDHLVALIKRLTEIHEGAYEWDSGVTDESITKFVIDALNNSGMSRNCVRPITTRWVKFLSDREAGIDNDLSVYLTDMDFSEEPPEDTEKPSEEALPAEFPDI